jgi:valyl-tRNA synthetase
MIMMGLKFMDDVPFREVYIHGLIRDAEGQKMSKSRGNVIDPLNLIHGIDLETLVKERTSGLMQPEMASRIEKTTRSQYSQGIAAYGTDALRFTFTALASTGRDIRFDLGRIEGYRNFCNKLWNATRYVLMNTEGKDTGLTNTEVALSLADRWIISLLQQVEEQVHQHLQTYRFDLLANTLYEFTWNEYCDWYLEFSKPLLQAETASVAAQRGTRRTLVRVLETILRLLHPIMPFITEELWQRVAPLAGKNGDTLMLQPYPQPQLNKVDTQAVQEIEWVKQFILGVRRIRAEMDINPGKALPILLANGTAIEQQRWQTHQTLINSLARLASVTWLAADAQEPESAIALVGELRILIPLAGLIDKAAELKRLTREIDKWQKELAKGTAKLHNPQFTERAPKDIVEREQQRVAEITASLQQLEAQAVKIRAL